MTKMMDVCLSILCPLFGISLLFGFTVIESTGRSYNAVKSDKLIVDLLSPGSDNVLQYFLMKLKLIFLISLSNRR